MFKNVKKQPKNDLTELPERLYYCIQCNRSLPTWRYLIAGHGHVCSDECMEKWDNERLEKMGC